MTKQTETNNVETPQSPQKNKDTLSKAHETKYCTLLQSVKMDEDKETGYTYAFERIFVKALEREELRLCIYKNMIDRGGKISNRMLVRPVDLTEEELLTVLNKAILCKMFTNSFLEELKGILSK